MFALFFDGDAIRKFARAPGLFIGWNNERVQPWRRSYRLAGVETRALQIQKQTFVTARKDFVTQMFSRSDPANFTAKFHQGIAIVAINADHSHRRIRTGKTCGEDDCERDDAGNANTIAFHDRLNLRSQEHAKRRNGREDSVHSLRWN